MGMNRHWRVIVVTAGGSFAMAVASAKPPDPALSRAEELYRRTEYRAVVDVVQGVDPKTAAGYALLGKALFMEGRYKEALGNLEKAIAEDSGNSDYYDWLGRAYGRLAESSSFVSALGYAKKTVRAFERAVDLGPSNLEALSDLFEFYLEAPGMVGGGLEKAEAIAMRIAVVNEAERHWTSARIAEKRKDAAAAEREYRAAMEAAPHEPGRALDLATFLYSRGRYPESEILFRDVEARHPNCPKVLFARAAAYIHGKRNLEEAQALLQKYLDSQTTSDDPPRLEALALLKSARH